jgi:hypothetical protein
VTEYAVEYKHQHVGIGFPVYCTDRDASALKMLGRAIRIGNMKMYAGMHGIWPCRPQYSTDPAELRWMADIAAGDDVWGA